MSFWDDLKAEVEKQQNPPKPSAEEMAESMAQVSEGMDNMLTLLAGHREKLAAQGFTAEAVEAMCVQFHGAMLVGAMGGQR